MLRNLFVASAFVALTSTVAVLTAGDDSAKKPGDESAAKSMHGADKMFASCLATGNQEEIIISGIGSEKATIDEVKKFAEMMVTDHHTFLTKLKKFAPEATQAGYLDAEGKEHAKKRDKDSKGEQAAADNKAAKIQQTAAEDNKARVETADAKADSKDGDHSHANHEHKLLQLERELAQQCLAQAKEQLAEKEGAEFDKCFMGLQIGMHMGMKAKLTVFQRHTSGELNTIIAEGLKTTEEHLAKAESIMKDLEHHPTIIEKTREGNKKERKVTKEIKDKD